MSELKVGDIVRILDGEGRGTILRIDANSNAILVKTSYSEVEYDEEDLELISPEDNKLAEEFAETCKSVHEQIELRLEEATKILRDAIALSEKHSVPFSSNISFLSNSYVPSSFSKSKFYELNSIDIRDVSGVNGYYIDDMFDVGGWVHSAIC